MNAKYYQKDQKNKSVGIVRVVAVVLILLSAGLLYQMYVEAHFQIYDFALRFHVRAASDAPEDQRRKLLVRDAVLWEIRPEADQAESAGELVERIEEMLPEIADVAAGILREDYGEKTGGSEGESDGSGGADCGAYRVRAAVVRERFPLRRYGNMLFPAGEYTALRVDIGAARGHNWWCAIYPELCYNAEESSSLSGKGKKDVERDVPGEERQVLFGEKGRFRMKIFEWFSGLWE